MIQGLPKESCFLPRLWNIAYWQTKTDFIKRRYEEGASTDPPACCWSFFHIYKSTNEQDLPVRKSYEHLIFHNLWLTTCQTLTWVFWWATMIHSSELWLLQDSVFFCRFCVWCFCSLEPPASLCCVLPWALHALNQRSSAKICQSNKIWFIKISGTQLDHSKHNHNDAYWLSKVAYPQHTREWCCFMISCLFPYQSVAA